MQEDPHEHVGVEVSVDGYLVIFAATLRPAVVAQLGIALAGDVQKDIVVREKRVHPLDRIIVQVAAQYFAVLLLVTQKVGQSQLLRLWRYMLTLLLQAEHISNASNAITTSLNNLLFILLFL